MCRWLCAGNTARELIVLGHQTPNNLARYWRPSATRRISIRQSFAGSLCDLDVFILGHSTVQCEPPIRCSGDTVDVKNPGIRLELKNLGSLGKNLESMVSWRTDYFDCIGTEVCRTRSRHADEIDAREARAPSAVWTPQRQPDKRRPRRGPDETITRSRHQPHSTRHPPEPLASCVQNLKRRKGVWSRDCHPGLTSYAAVACLVT